MTQNQKYCLIFCIISSVASMTWTVDDRPAKRVRGEGTELLDAATNGDHIRLARLLAEKDINPNITDENGKTALIQAVEREHLDCVNVLLAHKDTDPNMHDTEGNTALMYATGEVSLYSDLNADIVEALMGHANIDPNIQNIKKTALVGLLYNLDGMGCIYNHRTWLREEPINSDASDKEDDSDYDSDDDPSDQEYCALYGDYTQMKTALRQFNHILQHPRTNPNISNIDGETPLEIAAKFGYTPFLKALCNDPRTYLNRFNREHITTLMAICAGKLDFVNGWRLSAEKNVKALLEHDIQELKKHQTSKTYIPKLRIPNINEGISQRIESEILTDPDHLNENAEDAADSEYDDDSDGDDSVDEEDDTSDDE